MSLSEVTIPRPETAMRRRWPLWAAVGVTAFIATVHVVAGTPEMLGPLLSSGMDPVPAQTLRVVWHVVSAVLVTFPLALGWAARATPAAARPVLGYVWVLSAVFVGVFLAVDVDAFGTAVLTLPQWVLFLPPLVLIPLARPGSDH